MWLGLDVLYNPALIAYFCHCGCLLCFSGIFSSGLVALCIVVALISVIVIVIRSFWGFIILTYLDCFFPSIYGLHFDWLLRNCSHTCWMLRWHDFNGTVTSVADGASDLEETLPLQIRKSGGSRVARVRLSEVGLELSFCSSSESTTTTQHHKKSAGSAHTDLTFKSCDIIGCSLLRDTSAASPAVLLTIFAYPVQNAKRTAHRKRTSVAMQFNNLPTQDLNYERAALWERAIQSIVANSPGVVLN